jgi:hypothetical protein
MAPINDLVNLAELIPERSTNRTRCSLSSLTGSEPSARDPLTEG